MQIRYKTGETCDEYVTRKGWLEATAPPCPWHGEDHLKPWGFYPRVEPEGTWIRRFRCADEGRTVSLLPDCYAARVKGSLKAVEDAAGIAAESKTQVAAVERARPPRDGTTPVSARGWLLRRVRWVKDVLTRVKGLYPERFQDVEPTLEGFSERLRGPPVLGKLRGVAERHLQSLPHPVGFRRVPSAGKA